MNNIPEELLNKRNIIECNFLFCLYKQPEFITQYKIDEDDFVTEDGIFYYNLARALNNCNYQVFDSLTIYSFLDDKPTIKKDFDVRGGYKTIQEITDLINIENVDVYYDDLAKSNLLIRLHKAGFNVIQNLDKFKQMSSQDVYDFFEYKLADISIGKIGKVKVDNLSSGNDYMKAFREWDKGSDVGFRISSKILNHQLLGVHKKNLMLHLAGIGFGKTTSAVAWYVIPAVEDGNNVCILANEQDKESWMKMIISTVLFNKIGKVDKFSRHKLAVGGYSEEQFSKLDEAAEWLDRQPGKISFVELADYNVASIKKIITKQSKLNTSLFILDTMKPQDDSSDKSWGEFSEVAKELFLLSKKLDVAVVATAQLTPDAMARKFLDLTCIGKSRAIAETATSVVMFRPIMADEIEKIKGFTYEGKIKKEVKLDPDKSYICVFTPKNRYGQVSPQIIMERNLNFNTYRDVCWWECPYDNYRR